MITILNRYVFLTCLFALGGVHSCAFAQDWFAKYEGEEKAVALPGAISDVAVGGHGRFIFLYLQGNRQIAVYDANETKIVKYIPVASDDVKIVAGASRLFVFNLKQKLISRYEFTGWERETVQPLPFPGVFKTAALGYGSEGPMLVHWAVGTDALAQSKYDFVDLTTLRPITEIEPVRLNNTSYRDFVHIRASASGHAFGLWATSHTPTGLETLVLTGKKAKQAREHSSAGILVPGPLGRVLYTSRGLYTIELQPMGSHANGRSGGVAAFPTTLAEIGMHVELNSVSFFHVDSGTSIGKVDFSNLGEPKRQGWERHDFMSDKRYTCIAQAHQLVCIPYTNDKLIVVPCDIEKMISQQAKPFLFISSIAPTSVTKGKQLRYKIRTNAVKEKISYQLDAAPEGMKLSESGELTWDVPIDLSDDLVFVIISINYGNDSIFHTLKLTVR